MNSKVFYVLAILGLLACLNAHAQLNPGDKIDLYILIGQSNMAGRGPLTDELKNEHNARVFMFTRDSNWVEAHHPVHFDKPSVVAAGPGLAFGIAMANADAKVKIGLIPCAVGGTPIEHWEPGAFDKATNTHPYDDAVKRIKAAMKYGTIKGIIWHQGESNSSAETATGYMDKLIVLINRMRALAGDNTLPFIAGELGRYRPAYSIINNQLVTLGARVAYTGLATSAGLVHKGDTTHFDGPSADELGKRFAVQMLRVQRQISSHKNKHNI